MESAFNKPDSLGDVTKIMRNSEGADDNHRLGESMKDGRLLVTDSKKMETFNRMYAYIPRQVRKAKVDKAAKKRLHEPQSHSCQACEASWIEGAVPRL